jgi:peptidoglycan/LPS O-acetylase OafA/YrhL
MGTLRLILALLVLLSHADWRWLGLNPGVMAVMGFYLICGFVMAGLISRHYAAPGRARWFYLDRAARLLPQYAVVVGVTLLWHLVTATPTAFLTRAPSMGDLLNNLSVVPLNYYMVNGSDQYTLIPPAWSLGAEIQFYLLAPWLAWRPRWAWVLAAATLGVHALAWHDQLNTDWFGYRLLPGVLWVFILGMGLFHLQRSATRWALWAPALAAPVLAGLVWAYLQHRGLLLKPFHQEVLIGWGLGVPLLIAVAQLAPRLPAAAQRIDDWAGNASYGVFLNHFLLIWWLMPEANRSATQLALLAVCSVALSSALQWAVERPVLRWRRSLRMSQAATG